ncbi:hypothetical protein [Robbsia betulipollinis]|uniref:hypothetical protein n=1 Tax=Robbsia betulipollinis TaxID=2981849 RepID=UPI00227099B3|nr:hypothetical protein [Robbsia betulipollinis]
MNKTNQFSPAMRERAVRMAQDHIPQFAGWSREGVYRPLQRCIQGRNPTAH